MKNLTTKYNFENSSKSNILKYLQKYLKFSIIEPIYDFTVEEWHKNQKTILKDISTKFGSRIIIRSSVLGEDSLESSQAGNFESILDINPSYQNSVKKAITSVINSYEKTGHASQNNQILIQNQSQNISTSGVVFTRTPETASPYYVINYDQSHSTVSVTSGMVGNIIKIFRNTNTKSLSKQWKILLKSIKEIESILNLDKLDIEFGITKSNQVIIFQVRPITFIMKIPVNQNDKKINSLILQNKKQFNKLNKSTKLFGKRTIFSDMSDWNPAEIIGNNPNLFDYSLYDFLIMKKSWSKGRVQIGYHDMKSTPLMKKFGSKPYVDVRASFNSFLPSNLPSPIKKKLVNYYLNKLEQFPYLHDKVEFEILFSCYDLSMNSRLNELKQSGFSSKEIHTIKSSLIEFTNIIVSRFDSISNDSDDAILTLTDKREKSLSVLTPNSTHREILEVVEKLLTDCRTYGTIPFSSMARIAFISSILLKSLNKNGHISDDFFDLFLNSISTPLSEIQNDLDNYKKSKISKSEFLKKYGHLRPGTYDVTATRYDQQQQFLDNMKMFVSSKKTKKIAKPTNLTKLFKKHDLYFDSINFFDFVATSLILREKLKFEFTKNLSDAIELIARVGKQFGFTREDISKLDITTILKAKKLPKTKAKQYWKKSILKEVKKKQITDLMVMPPLIFCEDDFERINYFVSKPNFITNKKITSALLDLEQSKQKINSIENNIVLIENADPGYDWIFTKNPSGLITKYGGVASHMAIRCAEIGLPAAIGCGEILYEKLKLSSTIMLDCKNQEILILEHSSKDDEVEARKILKSLGYIK